MIALKFETIKKGECYLAIRTKKDEWPDFEGFQGLFVLNGEIFASQKTKN